MSHGATRVHGQFKFVPPGELFFGRKVFKLKRSERRTFSFRHLDLRLSHCPSLCKRNNLSDDHAVWTQLLPDRLGGFESQIKQIRPSVMSSDIQRQTFFCDC